MDRIEPSPEFTRTCETCRWLDDLMRNGPIHGPCTCDTAAMEGWEPHVSALGGPSPNSVPKVLP
jgi:hypothetical protein